MARTYATATAGRPDLMKVGAMMDNHVLESIRQATFNEHQSCRAMWPAPILATDAERVAENYGYNRIVAEAVANDINLAYGAVCIYCNTIPKFFDDWPAVATLRNDPRVGKTLELGHQEWESITGLPAFRRSRDWRTVTVKSGASDELLQLAVEAGEPMALEQLVKRIVAYVQAAKPMGRNTPSWNRELGKLSFDGEEIKSVRSVSVAKNVVKILDAFQEDGWPDRIDDPLTPSRDQQRLHEAIRRTNDNLLKIRFRADGTGEGIIWESTAREPHGN